MHQHRTFYRIIITALFLCTLVSLTAAPALARTQGDPPDSSIQATFTVNSLDDVNDGSCDASHCSLREAIHASNSSGGWDQIDFSVSGTILLGSALPGITDGVQIIGPGSGSLTIDGANAYQVFNIYEPAVVTLRGFTIANGYTVGNGGGLSNQSAQPVALYDVTFQANQALLPGGGLVNNSSSHMSLDGCVFMDNVSVGVGSGSAGGAILNTGYMEINNTDFFGNRADYGANGGGWGGAISNWSWGTIILTGGTFASNVAASGGAISNSGSLDLYFTYFMSNRADQNGFGDGGALHNEYTSGIVTLYSVTLDNNYAATRGGAIYNESSGQVTLNDSIVSNNVGMNSGGGIYNGQNPSNNLPHISLINTMVSNNSTPWGGGGVYNCGILDVSGGVFSGNGAYYGGGLYNFCPGTGQATLDQAQFSGNVATTQGGGIYNWANMTLNNAIVSTNIASSGGGFYGIGSDSLTIMGGQFNNNTASSTGGGLYLSTSSRPSLFGLTIGNNQAVNGAGLYNGGLLDVIASSFSQNVASTAGGGVYNAGSAQLALAGNSLQSNTAPYGGGLYTDRASIAYTTNDRYEQNSATDGGGIYINGGTLIAAQVNFLYNTAINNGGAVFDGIDFNSYPYTAGSLTLNTCTLSGNNAQNGAGVYNDGSSLTVSGGQLDGNIASNNGGGFYLGSRTSGWPEFYANGNIQNALITANAGVLGSGIFSNGDLALRANTLTNHSQGLYVDGGTLFAGGNTIAGNGNAGIVFGSGRPIIATVGGAPADANTFYSNGAGGTGNILVTAPSSNPEINALWNDWGVSALQSVENTITHRFDNPVLAQVNYYTVAVSANPTSQVADGVSPVVVTTSLSGWLNQQAGDLVNFDASLGSFSQAQVVTDASGQAVSNLTSNTPGTSNITTYAAVDTVLGRTATTSAEFTGLPTDLAITKTVDPSSALPGDTVSYVLSFTNLGQSLATDVIITDTLPVSLTNATISSSGVTITDTGYVPAYVWQVEDLLPGEGGVITITAQVVVPMPAFTWVRNTAQIATETDDSNSQNNLSWADFMVDNAPPTTNVPDQVVDEETLLSFNLNADDLNGDPIYYTLWDAPTGAALDAAGQFTWTPTEAQGPGYYTATVLLDDGIGGKDVSAEAPRPEATSWVTFHITVNEVNLPPVAVDDSGAGFVTDEATPVTLGDVLANDYDPDGDNLFVSGYDTSLTAGVVTFTPGTPGILDTTFGVNGLVTTDVYGGDDLISGMLVQPDGKIVTVGSNGYALVTTRYNPDGSLDTSFDEDGFNITGFYAIQDEGYAVALQPDGKILAVGYSLTPGQSSDFAMARYNPDGSLDTTWGGYGNITLDLFDDWDEAYAVAVQPDGKVLVGGLTNIPGMGYDFALVRLDQYGNLDTSFGSGGKVATDFEGGYDIAYEILLQPDGKIVLAGTVGSNYNGNNIGLARYNPDGSLDTSFGSGGLVSADQDTTWEDLYAAVLLPDGKIVTAGYYSKGYIQDDFSGIQLARFNSNGSLDTTFGTGGWANPELPGNGDYATDIALQPDGKLVLSGYTYNGNTYDFAVLRLKADGSYDTSFNGGYVLTDFAEDYDFAYAVAAQPDGKILAAGQAWNISTYDFALARYTGAGNTFQYDPNGQFEWLSTGEVATDTFTYDVSDGQLFDTATVSVTVTGLNDAPVLASIGNQSGDELSLISFTAAASDIDHLDTLTFSLEAGAPSGAAIDPASGVFTWTPTEAQGPGVYPVTVRVTDDGAPALDDSETINITVNEVNSAPVLDPIGDQTVDELSLLSFTATATDSDIPANTLTFSLDAGAPSGAVIDPNTGVFTWTPDEAQGPGVYPVTVRVTDNGTPALDDSETIQITVNEIHVATVDLALSMSGAIQEAISCTQTTFTLTVANVGQTDASGMSLSASLPAGLSYASSTPACSDNAGLVTCDLGDLPAAQFANVVMLVNVEGAGLLTTPASVEAEQEDSNPADNSASYNLTGLSSLVIFSDDFEDGASGSWSSALTSVTPSGRGFLGEFSNEQVFLALSALPAHCSVNVSYDLFVIRSWDGNHMDWPLNAPGYYGPDEVVGPDHFETSADGQSLLSTTFTNWNNLEFRQAYPGAFGSGDYPARSGADENNTLGYIHSGIVMDAVYNMSYDFAHLSDLLQVDFNAWGLQSIDDESWGIDNVVVTIGSGVTETPPAQYFVFLPFTAK